jgi:hypothetical protein
MKVSSLEKLESVEIVLVDAQHQPTMDLQYNLGKYVDLTFQGKASPEVSDDSDEELHHSAHKLPEVDPKRQRQIQASHVDYQTDLISFSPIATRRASVAPKPAFDTEFMSMKSLSGVNPFADPAQPTFEAHFPPPQPITTNPFAIPDPQPNPQANPFSTNPFTSQPAPKPTTNTNPFL